MCIHPVTGASAAFEHGFILTLHLKRIVHSSLHHCLFCCVYRVCVCVCVCVFVWLRQLCFASWVKHKMQSYWTTEKWGHQILSTNRVHLPTQVGKNRLPYGYICSVRELGVASDLHPALSSLSNRTACLLTSTAEQKMSWAPLQLLRSSL